MNIYDSSIRFLCLPAACRITGSARVNLPSKMPGDRGRAISPSDNGTREQLRYVAQDLRPTSQPWFKHSSSKSPTLYVSRGLKNRRHCYILCCHLAYMLFKFTTVLDSMRALECRQKYRWLWNRVGCSRSGDRRRLWLGISIRLYPWSESPGIRPIVSFQTSTSGLRPTV